MDPCGEISNAGSIIATGGSYYDTDQITVVNGRSFGRATEGFVINNDSSAALSYLLQRGCFAYVQLHELGHVLGLYHSTSRGAVMYPSISATCNARPPVLAADDIAGLKEIYPPPPSRAPTNVAIAVTDTAITITFDPIVADAGSASAAAANYRLAFALSPEGPMLYGAVSATTSVSIAIPEGLSGTFYVSVAGLNVGGTGPWSPPVRFTLPCAVPNAPTGLAAGVASGVASVSWNRSRGAAGYTLQVGSSPGSHDLFSGSVGTSTAVAATGVPRGFRAYVSVIAVNACGRSAASETVVIE
jgi:hypothetical protein